MPATGAEESERTPPRIAVLVPCHNEETTVGQVVREFARAIPEAEIWVFDNASTDGTAAAARAAGATVASEPRRGKGQVVASMLHRVAADFYVLVDGDSTYPADRVRDLLAPLLDGSADHVVGARRVEAGAKAYRAFHTSGNRIVTFLVNRIFGTGLEDVMSGYRAFHAEVARCVPFQAGGFDVETELTLQTLEKGFAIVEVPVGYRARPEGSHSKLSTWGDGFRVLLRIVTILKDFRPLAFFGGLAIVCGILSLASGWLPIQDYVRERYVYHVPLAVLAGILGSVAIGLLQTGVVLSSMNTRLLEFHRLRRRAASRERSP